MTRAENRLSNREGFLESPLRKTQTNKRRPLYNELFTPIRGGKRRGVSVALKV